MPPSRDSGRITRSQTGRRRNVRRTPRNSAAVLSNSPEPSNMDSTILIATPPPSNVPMVDLDILDPPSNFPSSSNRIRRPLEVDLTCELDDEVFVVLEDIINPSRVSPGNSFLLPPVTLGGNSSSTPMPRLLRLPAGSTRSNYPFSPGRSMN